MPTPEIARQEVIDELWRVTRRGRAALQDGRLSRAIEEVCLASLESDRLATDVTLYHQVESRANGKSGP